MKSTEFTRNYLGRWTQEPQQYKYESTSNNGSYGSTSWTSSRTDFDSALEYIYKAYDKYGAVKTTYKQTVRKDVRPIFPDSYPKGDLEKLFSQDDGMR